MQRDRFPGKLLDMDRERRHPDTPEVDDVDAAIVVGGDHRNASAERGDRRDGAEHESLLAHGDLDAAAEHQHARVGERSGIGAVEADEVGPAFGSQRLRTRWCRIDAEQRAEDALRGDRHGLTAAVRERDDTDTVVRRDGERGDEARDPSAVTDGAMTADIVTEERQSDARMGRARLIVPLERHRERLGLHDAPPVVEQRGRVRRHVGQGREDRTRGSRLDVDVPR